MVLNGSFHKTHEGGLLGNVPQNLKKKCKLHKTLYVSDRLLCTLENVLAVGNI